MMRLSQGQIIQIIINISRDRLTRGCKRGSVKSETTRLKVLVWLNSPSPVLRASYPWNKVKKKKKWGGRSFSRKLWIFLGQRWYIERLIHWNITPEHKHPDVWRSLGVPVPKISQDLGAVLGEAGPCPAPARSVFYIGKSLPAREMFMFCSK